MNLKGKRVLVLGLGISGMSMVRWLTGRGAIVRVADTRVQPPLAGQLNKDFPDVELRTGQFDQEAFRGADVVAISPGVPLAQPLVKRARDQGIPVLGDIELFAHARKQHVHSKVIAITGSNGKSTVTEMVGAMCKAAGARTEVAGNIGLPILDVLTDIDAGKRRVPDIFVLELSSFQLETTATLDAEAAAWVDATTFSGVASVRTRASLITEPPEVFSGWDFYAYDYKLHPVVATGGAS